MSPYNYFKFRSINKYLISSLVNSELYFASPAELNDPFDCQVNIISCLDRAIQKSKNANRQVLINRRTDLIKFFDQLQNYLPNKFGVCSFAKIKPLSQTLMWSHYADNHRGICLTYYFPDEFINENVCDGINNYYGIIGRCPIKYDSNPLTDWFINEGAGQKTFEKYREDLVLTCLTIKDKAWEYEKEERIIKYGAGLYPIKKEYLKQICFGLATSDEDMNLIRKIVDQGSYNVEFYKIERCPESDFGIRAVEC